MSAEKPEAATDADLDAWIQRRAFECSIGDPAESARYKQAAATIAALREASDFDHMEYKRLRDELKAENSALRREVDKLNRQLKFKTNIAISNLNDAEAAERELAAAVSFIRVLGEEVKSHGDREQTLAKVRAMKGELAAAREDAERYRWLRDCDTEDIPTMGGELMAREALDEHIDAAIAAERGKG